MAVLALILLLLGAVLFIIEMFIPGFGVCGVTGIVLVVVSSVITVIHLPFGIFIVLGEIAVLALVAATGWRYIKKHQLYGKLILDESLNMDGNEIGDLEFFLGKEGVASTPLRPFGVADFNGVSLEVSSNGPYIQKDTRVKVIEAVNNKIIVRAEDDRQQ